MALDLLAFAAHRDDTEITVGGLLLRMVQKGYKVGACDLTQGEMGTRGSAPERKAECDEATRILGLAVRVNCELQPPRVPVPRGGGAPRAPAQGRRPSRP